MFLVNPSHTKNVSRDQRVLELAFRNILRKRVIPFIEGRQNNIDHSLYLELTNFCASIECQANWMVIYEFYQRWLKSVYDVYFSNIFSIVRAPAESIANVCRDLDELFTHWDRWILVGKCISECMKPLVYTTRAGLVPIQRMHLASIGDWWLQTQEQIPNFVTWIYFLVSKISTEDVSSEHCGKMRTLIQRGCRLLNVLSQNNYKSTHEIDFQVRSVMLECFASQTREHFRGVCHQWLQEEGIYAEASSQAFVSYMMRFQRFKVLHDTKLYQQIPGFICNVIIRERDVILIGGLQGRALNACLSSSLTRHETDNIDYGEFMSALNILYFSVQDDAAQYQEFCGLFKVHVQQTLVNLYEDIVRMTEDQQKPTVNGNSEKNNAESSEDATRTKSDIVFGVSLFRIWQHYVQNMIPRAFQNDINMSQIVSWAVKEQLNQPIRTISIEELLAIFVDTLIYQYDKVVELGVAQYETWVKFVGWAISYLHNKDYFEEFSIRHMSARILEKVTWVRNAEEVERERIMWSHALKDLLSPTYNHKVQTMWKDYERSIELDKRFKTWQRDNAVHNETRQSTHPMELKVHVLATSIWPIAVEQQPFIISPLLQEQLSLYETFYQGEHGNRKMSWLHHLGKVTLQLNESRRIELHMALCQALVCLLFRQRETTTLTIQDIMAATGMNHLETKRAISGLSLGRTSILLVSSKKMDKTDQVSWNDEFQASRQYIRIVLPKVIVRNQKGQNEATAATLAMCDNTRKFQYDAAIVRILKARRTLDLQNLISEVCNQIKLFVPDPTLIKKRVEDLMNREYIGRDATNTSVFHYIA